MSTLEDLEAGMDAACMAALGDSITFRPAGGSVLPLSAYVDFEELARSLDGGQAIEQAMTVQILCSDLPARPTGSDRVTLGKVPGKTFKPINVTRDKSGTHWAFDLQAVNA